MRQAPACHTHSKTPFGPQQRRFHSINAKRSPAMANGQHPGSKCRKRADFKRRSAVEIKNGVDVLRAVVRARRFKSHLSSLARDLNVPVGDLEDFVDSGRELPMPVLQKLAREFFDAEIDVATGLLRSANRNEAKPLCTAYPEQRDPKLSPYYRPMLPGPHLPGPQPVKPEPPQPKRGRPGWIGEFW